MSEALTGGKFAIAAAIIVQDGKLLMGPATCFGGLALVAVPGRGVEPGETFEQAAVREAAEETGLTVPGERVHPNTGLGAYPSSARTRVLGRVKGVRRRSLLAVRRRGECRAAGGGRSCWPSRVRRICLPA